MIRNMPNMVAYLFKKCSVSTPYDTKYDYEFLDDIYISKIPLTDSVES